MNNHKKLIISIICCFICFSFSFVVYYIFELEWLSVILSCISSSFVYSFFTILLDKQNSIFKDLFILILTTTLIIIDLLINKSLGEAYHWVLIPTGCTALFNLINRKIKLIS